MWYVGTLSTAAKTREGAGTEGKGIGIPEQQETVEWHWQVKWMVTVYFWTTVSVVSPLFNHTPERTPPTSLPPSLRWGGIKGCVQCLARLWLLPYSVGDGWHWGWS